MSEADSHPVPAPRANARLLGQEAAEQTLVAAYRSGRLPHAWLLSGPRGVGKATLAFRFARFVLAGEGQGGLFGAPSPSLDLEEDHPVFKRVAAESHPDLFTLERRADEKTGKLRQDIVVKDVRALGQFLRRTPGEAEWRVAVADGVEDLNQSAANAILKLLEEPPPRALLLLVSHAPGRLLPTIRSRCCQLPLPALENELVERLLGDYAPELSPEDARALAALGDGSVGRSLDLAASGGLDLYREIVALIDGLPRLDVPKVHALGDRLSRKADGGAFRTTAELLSWWLARMIHAAASGAPAAEVLAGDAALMARLAARGDLAQWLDLWEKLSRLFARAEGANLDRKQVMITAFLELEALAA